MSADGKGQSEQERQRIEESLSGAAQPQGSKHVRHTGRRVGVKARKLPKTLEKFIHFLEDQGFVWSAGRGQREGQYYYWARVRLASEKEDVGSVGFYQSPVDALADAYSRHSAQNYRPLSEQMG